MSRLRVAIITGCDHGMASMCLPALVANESIELVGVLFALPLPKTLADKKRKLKKLFKIGLLGALNGIRMRKWYADDYESLDVLCSRLSVPMQKIEGINSEAMQTALRNCGCDLALSLGNDYISEKVFSIPRFGMLNVHSEILPAYQNAQSIIWPIYCNDPFTGFTIHEVSKKMDGGRILAQKRMPIEFRSSLEATVRASRSAVDSELPSALSDVCARVEELKQKALPQEDGHVYTTPSIWQFLRMVRNNQRFWKERAR